MSKLGTESRKNRGGAKLYLYRKCVSDKAIGGFVIVSTNTKVRSLVEQRGCLVGSFKL